jgi:hypothetical protein
MANRFLDTNFYKSPFVRSLKGSLKSLYGFIICDCDGAGIWNYDLQIAGMYIGFEVTDEEFEENFVKRGKAVKMGGGKYFFPDFIEHQYPSGLQLNNKAHSNFINTLKKYDLIDENLKPKIKAPLEAPSMPPQGATGNGLGNGNSNGKGLGNGNVPNDEGSGEEEIPNNFQSLNNGSLISQMAVFWKQKKPTYPEDEKKDKEALRYISNFICKQEGISYQPQDVSVSSKVMDAWTVIVNHLEQDDFYGNKSLNTIKNSLQSIIQDIHNGKSKSTSKNGKPVTADAVKEALDRRYPARQ